MKNSIQSLIAKKKPQINEIYECVFKNWRLIARKMDIIIMNHKKQLLSTKIEFSNKLTTAELQILFNKSSFIMEMLMKSISYQTQFLDKVLLYKFNY